MMKKTEKDRDRREGKRRREENNNGNKDSACHVEKQPFGGTRQSQQQTQKEA